MYSGKRRKAPVAAWVGAQQIGRVDRAESRRIEFGEIEFMHGQLRQRFGSDGNDGVLPGQGPGRLAVHTRRIDDATSGRRIAPRDPVAAEQGSRSACGPQRNSSGMLFGRECLRDGIASGVYDTPRRGGPPGACAFRNYVQDISSCPFSIDALGIAAFPSIVRIFHCLASAACLPPEIPLSPTRIQRNAHAADSE